LARPIRRPSDCKSQTRAPSPRAAAIVPFRRHVLSGKTDPAPAAASPNVSFGARPQHWLPRRRMPAVQPSPQRTRGPDEEPLVGHQCSSRRHGKVVCSSELTVLEGSRRSMERFIRFWPDLAMKPLPMTKSWQPGSLGSGARRTRMRSAREAWLPCNWTEALAERNSVLEECGFSTRIFCARRDREDRCCYFGGVLVGLRACHQHSCIRLNVGRHA